jgi:hypothetical protein
MQCNTQQFVDSYTYVHEVEAMIVAQLDLIAQQPFALFEQSDTSKECHVTPFRVAPTLTIVVQCNNVTM